jgi:hypothetical protein
MSRYICSGPKNIAHATCWSFIIYPVLIISGREVISTRWSQSKRRLTRTRIQPGSWFVWIIGACVGRSINIGSLEQWGSEAGCFKNMSVSQSVMVVSQLMVQQCAVCQWNNGKCFLTFVLLRPWAAGVTSMALGRMISRCSLWDRSEIVHGRSTRPKHPTKCGRKVLAKWMNHVCLFLTNQYIAHNLSNFVSLQTPDQLPPGQIVHRHLRTFQSNCRWGGSHGSPSVFGCCAVTDVT